MGPALISADFMFTHGGMNLSFTYLISFQLVCHFVFLPVKGSIFQSWHSCIHTELCIQCICLATQTVGQTWSLWTTNVFGASTNIFFWRYTWKKNCHHSNLRGNIYMDRVSFTPEVDMSSHSFSRFKLQQVIMFPQPTVEVSAKAWQSSVSCLQFQKLKHLA